jgi:hypothetical protein
MKRYVILLGLMLLVASCASMNPQRPAGFETYDTVVVEVLPEVAIDDEHVQMLQNILVDALEERPVFRTVRTSADETAHHSLIIQVNVTRLKVSTNVDRIVWGRLAGSNVIAADIAAMDGATRQVLSSFSLKGESPDYPPSFDWPWGNVEVAMERLSRQLASILLYWAQPTGSGS